MTAGRRPVTRGRWWLSLPVASATWDQVVPELVRLGLVGRLDGLMVELFCTSYERWRGHGGGPGYASLTAVVARLARDLGLGSGARLRTDVPQVDRLEQELAVFGYKMPP